MLYTHSYTFFNTQPLHFSLQEMEDKKMRSYAVIPPALFDLKTRSRRFKNTNGLMEDPMQEYKDKQFLNLWTDQEKEIFKVMSN